MLAGRLFPRAADGRRFRLEEVPVPTPGRFRQQQLRGHYGSEPDHVLEPVRLRRAHRIDFAESVSAVLPPAEAGEAIQALENKEGDPIRIVLTP
jgi:threonine dehydrogenase-like Zn-dependent dehydrogenase